jgi:ribosome recycling factor
VSDGGIVEVALAEAREHMAKAVGHVREEFVAVRTGRAVPALVERVRVDYYGSEVPLQQLAGVSAPEARLLVISPYDKAAMGAIEKALMASDIGITPSNDGQVIRLRFPTFTEERRKELVKVVRHKARRAGWACGPLGAACARSSKDSSIRATSPPTSSSAPSGSWSD